MSHATRPAVVVFDVNETLFDLSGLRPRFAAVGLSGDLVPLWFARVLRDGFALTVLGDYRSFADLGAAHLRALAGGGDEALGASSGDTAPSDISLSDEARSDATLSAHTRSDAALSADAVRYVLAGMAQLDPHPDVAPALRRLADAGVRAVTLTNGGADNTVRLLERAMLASYVEQVLSVDTVRRWKPAPEPYRHAVEACRVRPDQAVLVAAHGWDLAGARNAGLGTAYISRSEPLSAEFPPPDVLASDLDEVAVQLLSGDPGGRGAS